MSAVGGYGHEVPTYLFQSEPTPVQRPPDSTLGDLHAAAFFQHHLELVEVSIVVSIDGTDEELR